MGRGALYAFDIAIIDIEILNQGDGNEPIERPGFPPGRHER
jgi:hypothetical protein